MAKGKAKVIDVDKGYRKLVDNVFGIKDPKVAVGIMGEKAQERYDVKHADGTETKGATLVEVAMWNEFGTENIPARPFLRGWIDGHTKEITEHAKKLLVKVITGKLKREQALEQLGQWMVGQVQLAIAKGGDPPFAPNAQTTITRKGSSKPLIATGVMRGAVSYKVVDK